MKKKYFVFFSLLLFLFTNKVSANSISGYFAIPNTTLEIGQSKTLTVSIPASGVKSIDGNIASKDTSCVQVTSNSYMYNIISPASPNEIKVAGSVTIKALKECSTTLVMNRVSIGTTSEEEYDTATVSGTITVKAKQQEQTQPSGNNNTNTGSNSGSNTGTNTNTGSNTKPSTNTNTNTNTNTTNNNTSSNTTNNNNNNQNNTNNNQKNNDTNKNKENLSKDNTLESLSIDNYEISFNKNNTNYSITINYDVEEIKVNAKASDNKANVNITGNTNLKYGDNNVKVVVTAENGDKKTYTIKVTRTPDPNKNLSTNNDLTSIIPSTGVLSPVFNKDVLDYVIYLPYEVDKISFEVTLADNTASIEKEEQETLIVGNNIYKYNVRAENGNIKTYTITVKRAGLFATNNTKLKSLELTNGKLNSNFDSDKFIYYYSKNKEFSFDAIAEDENSTVKTYEKDGIITIVVEAPNGDYSVYYLLPNKYHNSIFMLILMLIIGFALGFGTYYYLNVLNKKKKKKQR